MSRRDKYFVVVEGKDRAILRSDLDAARRKKRVLEKYNPDKRVHIFVAQRLREDV